jgi:simple sugar transport system permease protein
MIDILTDPAQLTDFLASALRLAVPVAFAALGGVLSERSGVINIGLEGMMLAGAFGAAIGSYYSGSGSVGVVTAVLAGGLAGLLLGFLSVTLRVNQLVGGIAVNLLCVGLTAFFARQVFGENLGRAFVAGFDEIAIPYLSDIPIAGPVIFHQDVLVYLLFALVRSYFFCCFARSGVSTCVAPARIPRRPIPPAFPSSGSGMLRLHFPACLPLSAARI